MKLTLLPPKLEKRLIEKIMPFIVHRASKVIGKGASFTQNGRWIMQTETETKMAYEAIGRDAWMYAAAYTITSSASMLPFGVYKRSPSTKGSEYSLDESDQLTNLWLKPNPYQTSEEFIESCYWSLELSGKLFVEVVGGKKSPTELYILDPRRMKINKDHQKFIAGYEYDLDGKKVPFTPDEIIFHKYTDPSDPYGGLAACTPAGDAINSDISSNEYNNAFFDNSGIPSGVLKTERRINDTEADAIALSWGKSHKGSKKAHKVAVLYGGLEFEVIQKSPKDMEFSKQKGLNREEILAAYGVPPVLVGLLESVNYSNAREQKKLFWQHTMRPKLVNFAKRMSLEFGLDGFKRKFMFDLSDVDALQEDEEIKSRIAFNLSKSGFSWDEIRKRIYKLAPLKGGVGVYPWVPTNMVPANLQMNGPAQAKPQTGKPGKPDGPSDNPGPEGRKPEAGKDLSPKEQELDEMIKRLEQFANDSNNQGETVLVG